MDTSNIEHALGMARHHLAAGRLVEAESICRGVLSEAPGETRALHLLAGIAVHTGELEKAVELLRQALVGEPSNVLLLAHLAELLGSTGRAEEAVSCYERAILLQPGDADAHNKLGVLLSELGQTAEARSHFETALSLRPNDADAHNNLGSLHARQGRQAEAEQSLRRAITLRPVFPAAENNLGILLQKAGRIDEAIAHYQRAVNGDQGYIEALKNLGALLLSRGHHQRAGNVFKRLLELNSNDADVHNFYAAAVMELERVEEAREHFARALELNPAHSAAANNLGSTLMKMDRMEEAREFLERALELRPGYGEALNNLASLHRKVGPLELSLEMVGRAVEIEPASAVFHSNLVLGKYYHPAMGREDIHAELQRWNQRHAAPMARYHRPHPNVRDPNRRLKIGYVSPDFCTHVISQFLLPLLEAHDCSEVETHCYSSVIVADATTERARKAAHLWRDVASLNFLELVETIRADGIDILVDLSSHTAGNRLDVFGCKPAPVQVSWLAFAGSTGVEAIDYRLTDRHMDPPNSDQSWSAEEPICLPDAWCCYEPLSPSPTVSSLPALKNGFLRFGSLNNFAKINDAVLRQWALALRAVPRSRLLMHAPVEGREHVQAVLSSESIQPSRIEFVGRQSPLEYLQTYGRIDIGLDPFPFNGMTTTCDALWMGVPVLSLPGELPAARAGLSLLATVGLPAFIAQNPQDYAAKAASLTANLQKLSHVRTGLRQRMKASPLMNAPRFARNVEAAYRTMWLRWIGAS